MSHTRQKIAVIGSNMVDLICTAPRRPAPGETLEATGFEIDYGGKGANQAVAAARLGANVMMLTKLGDDLFAQNTLANFRNHGIDTRHACKVPGVASGVASICVEPSGENSILINKGANACLLPADIDAAAEDLKTCQLILLQLEVPLATVTHAIAFAAKHGIATVLNPAPAVADLDINAIRGVTFLVPNETELAMLSGLPTDTDAAIVSAARSLIARGIRTLIVTLGARGARLVSASQTLTIPTPRVTACNTTGAGDAFIGAFAHFYVAGLGLEAALHHAALYAADSITRPGTQQSYASAAAFAEFCRTRSTPAGAAQVCA